MGCGCGKKLGGGLRGVGKRPVSTPRRGTSIVPRNLGPTQARQLAKQNASASPFTAQRRDLERKRRLAIQRALGK